MQVCMVHFSMTTKIFQCSNGHVVCGDCKPNLKVNSKYIPHFKDEQGRATAQPL